MRTRIGLKRLMIVAALAAVALLSTTAFAGIVPKTGRPNVIVIMTDDQTVEQLPVLPSVAELAREGATFTTNFASYPLCCPSRSTYLTGQYAHNHGVEGNFAPYGGYYKLRGDQTLPVWLSESGYHTAHIGKYLNEYGQRKPEEVPPGWQEWHGSIDPSTYNYLYYKLNENGQVIPYSQQYQADVYTRKAIDYIRRRAPQPQPFFLSVAYLGPHSGFPSTAGQRCEGSAQPAARHFGHFGSVPLPKPPSFNEADVSDKPSAVSSLPRFSAADIDKITQDYQCRREALLAVDEGIRQIVAALRVSGEYDNTLIAFTSDNGFFQGEHRIPMSKFKVYEPSVRVPFVLRGPGVPPGARVNGLTANIDLGPTILQAAGATAAITQDGRSLFPVLQTRQPDGNQPDRGPLADRALLLENGPGDGAENTQYDAVRTERYVYAEYVSGERELYDLQRDPDQLTSVHNNPAYDGVRRVLAKTLLRLRTCAGDGCQVRVAVPEPGR